MDRRDANQLSKFAKVEREVTAALADDLRTYAVKRWPTMNHEWRKAKLASLLGMRVRRVRSYWDAEETLSPREAEVDAIKSLIGAEKDDVNAEAHRALEARFASMEAELAELRAAIAAASLAVESSAHGGSGRGIDSAGQGLHGRRATDRIG